VPAPTIIATQWVDGFSGAPASANAAGVLAEITLANVTGGAAEVLVQTRISSENIWQTLPSDSGHWRLLPAPITGRSSLRIALEPTQSIELRLRFRTARGRLGEFSEAHPLEALP
jgi:hypothetical protein